MDNAQLNEAKQVETWAIIIAENPQSKQLLNTTNRQRTAQLANLIRNLGFQPIPCTATADKTQEDAWPDEHGFLVKGITLLLASSIGRHFEQHAIIYKAAHQPCKLIWLSLINDKPQGE